MIHIKNKEEQDILRESGKRLASVLSSVSKKVVPGVSTLELDAYVKELISDMGDTPSFLHYTPEGISYPYPNALCVSVNDEIVHGIAKEGQVLKEGDIVTLDCGLCHKGYHTDSALTVPVGKIDKAVQQLLWDTNESLYKGIEMMRAGNTVGDVGHAIESFVDDRYGIIRVLCGHGIGKEVHEEPQVPNYGKKGTGAVLKAGMVIAVEPMLTLGSEHAVSLPDEYTFVTEDESPSAHFEHTILVTDGDPEILTERI